MDSISKALNPYLIPPLITIISDYLTYSYTLELEDNSDLIPFYLRCKITPLKNCFQGIYSPVLSPTEYEQLPQTGWTMEELPGYFDLVDGPGYLVSKSFEGSLDTFEAHLEALTKEDPSFDQTKELGLYVTLVCFEGVFQGGSKIQVWTAEDFVTCMREFVGDLRKSPIGVEGSCLWEGIEQRGWVNKVSSPESI